jgi:hypothetical protein
MKCEDINRYIDDFLDQNLMPEDLKIFKGHLSGCKVCADKLEMASNLLAGLRQLPVEPPAAEFRVRVFSQLRQQYPQPRESGYRFAAGFASAMVASLAIWFVSTLYVPDAIVDQPPMISVAMDEMQTVRLLFDSQKDFQQVTLSIDLPRNIELDGYPGQKNLSWQTQLQKGQNILALPVVATAYGQGELLAQLNYGDKVKTFRIVLKTNADGVQRSPLNQYLPA